METSNIVRYYTYALSSRRVETIEIFDRDIFAKIPIILQE